jgi:hypothetical protein
MTKLKNWRDRDKESECVCVCLEREREGEREREKRKRERERRESFLGFYLRALSYNPKSNQYVCIGQAHKLVFGTSKYLMILSLNFSFNCHCKEL